MLTRALHILWCKRRAFAHLERGSVRDALWSMLSDMDKHIETAGHEKMSILRNAAFTCTSPEEAKKVIETMQ